MHWPYGKRADTLCVCWWVCVCACVCVCMGMAFLNAALWPTISFVAAVTFDCICCPLGRVPLPPHPLPIPYPLRYVCQCVCGTLSRRRRRRRLSEIAQNCFPFRFIS